MNPNRNTILQVSMFVMILMGVADAQPRWALQSMSGPSLRGSHGMAYDSCRGVVVLFGGADTSQVLGETWEWNGSAWLLRSTTGPGPRANQAMAFDSNRCVTVLFGGSAGVYLNDTWEWDGNNWTQKCSTCPPSPRHGAGMTFDSTRNVLLMFGGWVPHMNDTWQWDGTTWTQVTTTAPPSPRDWVGMAYDSSRDRTVIFGGFTGGSCSDPNRRSDETWELDMSTSPANWTQIATPNRPPARGMGRLVRDAADGKMVLFGGELGCNLMAGDTWKFDGQIPSWTLVNQAGTPEARDAHDMVYDQARQEVLMFGGVLASGMPLGDTWSYGNRAYAIPTLSAWGLATTTLLLLCAGCIMVARRKLRAAGM